MKEPEKSSIQREKKPMLFDPRKHPEVKGELFNLISTAYAEIGGHAKIKNDDDVFADPDWNYWACFFFIR